MTTNESISKKNEKINKLIENLKIVKMFAKSSSDKLKYL